MLQVTTLQSPARRRFTPSSVLPAQGGRGPAHGCARRRRRGLGSSKFEALARQRMSEHYDVPLEPGWVGQVHKRFDFVAPYGRIVGDAMYYTPVRGTRWPPAKAASITEHVWLLEKTGAPETFLVFGNDRQVPVLWLERYGNLVSGVTFFFLSDEGALEELPNAGAVGGGRP